MQTDSIESRSADKFSFESDDGTNLFFRAWAPKTDSRKAVILFHRGHEHSGRWQEIVDRMNLPDCWFFAWDARGHGESPGERGDAPSFGQMIRDADRFVKHISEKFEIAVEDMAVVGQSVGAVLAAAWVHDYAPAINSLTLATPAFRIKLYVPFAIPGLRLLRRLRPKSFIKSYVSPRMLTHDPEQAATYAADPLISPQISVKILLDLFDTSSRLLEDAGAIQVPTLMMVSGADWVVRTKPQQQFFERLSSQDKQLEIYPDFYHSTFWEKDRDQPIARTRDFISSRFEQAAPPANLIDGDKQGFSKSVYDQLSEAQSVFSPRRWGFAAMKVSMNTIGRLSRGVQVGWETGFDSGKSLDYVYQNTADGITPLGRFFDRQYLNSPGWKGIRQRKIHLQSMLDRSIAQIKGQNLEIRILDIAAGVGRYILDTIKANPAEEISAVLCDCNQGGLQAGRQLAESMEINSVEYRENDAFDAHAIARLDARPTIVVVSGLYELFPQNDLIRESLKGIARAIESGGRLIYTNQPWHPQQEFIARVLPNRDGDPWVMRCRTQAEMDQLVAEAGFQKIDMLIDDEGIFSVSLAEKI